MSREKLLRSRLIRYSAWLVAVVMVVFGLQVGLLAFPQLLLANKAEAGSVVVYYDGDADPGVQILADDTDRRLRAGNFGVTGDPARLFFFRDQGLYSLFARLTGVPPQAQGFGISFLGTTYVSATRVEALGDKRRLSLMLFELGHAYNAGGKGRVARPLHTDCQCILWRETFRARGPVGPPDSHELGRNPDRHIALAGRPH